MPDSPGMGDEGARIEALRHYAILDTSLNFHQPDLESPDDLLGTCPECGTWHLMVTTVHGFEIFVVELPARPSPPSLPTS